MNSSKRFVITLPPPLTPTRMSTELCWAGLHLASLQHLCGNFCCSPVCVPNKAIYLRASALPCCKILLISQLTLFCLHNARGFWIKTLVLPCWIRWKSPSYPSFLSSLVTSSRCLGKHTVIIPAVYSSSCQQCVYLMSQRQYLSDFSSILGFYGFGFVWLIVVLFVCVCCDFLVCSLCDIVLSLKKKNLFNYFDSYRLCITSYHFLINLLIVLCYLSSRV